MLNKSQIRDPKCWEKWRRAGAIGGVAIDPARSAQMWQKYHDALALLVRGIQCPTVADLLAVAPHLSVAEANEILDSDKTVYFAAPPLRVRGRVRVISFSPASTHAPMRPGDEGKDYPPALHAAFVRCGTSRDYLFHDRVAAFAEANWPTQLIDMTWGDATGWVLEDPSDLIPQPHKKLGYPRAKAWVGVVLNRPVNDIINDRSAPESQLFDNAIAHMTNDRVIYEELQNDKGRYGHHNNCALCGSGLNLTACDACNLRFDDNCSRTGGGSPLPPRVATFFREHGHVFAKDLSEAYVAEVELLEKVRAEWREWEAKRLLATDEIVSVSPSV